MKNVLNIKFWDDYKLKSNVRRNLLKIANSFIEFCDVPDLNVLDIVFLGSNANFDWHSKSDVDLHIMVDFSNFGKSSKYVKKMLDDKRWIWNKQHDISIYKQPVEVYVEDVADNQPSTGKYSILQNKWVIKPTVVNKKIDVVKVENKTKDLKRNVDDLQKEYKSIKDKNYDSLIEKLQKFKDSLKSMRKSGLYNNGQYSVENITYKNLRNDGYLDKLINLYNKIVDANLTIETFLD